MKDELFSFFILQPSPFLECPEWESNPHALGFKPSRSAGWRIRAKVREEGLEPSFSGSEPDGLPLADSRMSSDRGEGFEPSSPGSKPGSLPLADPRIRVPCGNRTHLRQFGRLPPLPIGQGHVVPASRKPAWVKRKGRESNPQGIAARPFSRRLPSPV